MSYAISRHLALAGTLLKLAGGVHACECIEPDLANAYQASTLVISGSVVRIDTIQVAFAREPTRTRPMMRYTVRIDETFKGSTSAATVFVHSGMSDAECGMRMRVGRRYILYTFTSCDRAELICPHGPNDFWTDICTRSRAFEQQEATALMRLK